MFDDELHDFVVSADVERADEYIGPGLNEPAFQVSAYMGRHIVGNNYSHGFIVLAGVDAARVPETCSGL